MLEGFLAFQSSIICKSISGVSEMDHARINDLDTLIAVLFAFANH